MTDEREYFVHSHAICETSSVGAGTTIWAFAHILPGAVVGRDCNINDGVFIENDVRVGDRVTVKCGVQLWDGVELEDDVFVGPNATFTNDPFPRSRQPPANFERTNVQRGASIGANATVLPGLTIGRDALVGAGAVVTRDVPDRAIVTGNPARVVGYVDTALHGGAVPASRPAATAQPTESSTDDARLIQLRTAADMRGALVAAQFPDELPFTPQRFFVVHDVPSAHVRGAHAHRACEQLLVCIVGTVNAVVDDGARRVEYVLDRPDLGLYMPPLRWGTQYRYSSDAVLLVMASDPYDPGDYIREYEDFLREVKAHNGVRE